MIYKTDWISSRPVYYNERTKNISRNINQVIDWNNVEIDVCGLKNYLQFGYNIFDQTMIKNVKILRFSSEIYCDEQKNLVIKELDDPTDDYFAGNSYNGEEVIDIISRHIRDWEHSQSLTKNRYLLPLSGGFDSRLLALLINDKKRIDAFTYGVSWDQSNSDEVANAKYVSEKLNLNWNRVEIGNFNQSQYLKKNFDIFGPTIPMHCMYHMEFYDRIISKFGKSYTVVSGSVGDWWSGEKVPLQKVSNPDEFTNVFFNHGICVPPEVMKVKVGNDINEKHFEIYRHRLEDSRYRRLFMARGRNNLSHWITRLPEEIFGSAGVYTPFEDIKVAMPMLMLKEDLAKNRKWERDFFERSDLLPEESRIKSNFTNKLDLYSIANFPIEPLRVDLLKEFIDESYLNSINSEIAGLKESSVSKLFNLHASLVKFGKNPLLNYFVKKLNKRACKLSDKAVKSYNAWTVLKTLEYVMLRRGS